MPTIVPYLCINGAEAAINFYGKVFGAVEKERYQNGPDAPIGHVTLELLDSALYLSDEFPEIGVISPTTLGGTPMAIHVTVPNVDSVFALAIQNGAKVLREPADQGIGFRNAKFLDPFGHAWMVSSPL
jgi:PhnB protein